MKIINCIQGSEEWHEARAGVITASMFKIARSRVGGLDDRQQQYVTAILAGESESAAMTKAGYKATPKADAVKRAIAGEAVGEFSAAALDYAFRLAIERISRKPLDEGFETWQMRRGHEFEPAARLEHEMQTGEVVEQVGFVVTDDNLFGASADGFIRDDGGSEYKCLVSPERLREIILNADISEFTDQVQGCMWVTGRNWWDFCVYCPALEPIGKQFWYRRIQRDDNYIEKMELELLEFAGLVAQHESLLRLKEAA